MECSVASTEVDVKQRTDKERREVVEAWRRSGETIERFCRHNAISPESLKRWRHRPGVLGTSASFLPVAVVQNYSKAYGNPCLIKVGDLVLIECGERTGEEILTKAIRAAVAACGPNSAR